jgi:hypothetical protein
MNMRALLLLQESLQKVVATLLYVPLPLPNISLRSSLELSFGYFFSEKLAVRPCHRKKLRNDFHSGEFVWNKFVLTRSSLSDLDGNEEENCQGKCVISMSK